MYLADYHLHTICSHDGHATLEDMARAAKQAGMDEICVTDHCDLLSTHGGPDRSFRWEPDEEQLALARPRLEGLLPIKKGLELGEAWEDPELSRQLVSRPGVDFIIGSIHNMDAAHGGVDLCLFHYDTPEDCVPVLDNYVSCLEQLCVMDCYDVLGHIIYPLRYMAQRDGCQIDMEPWFPRLENVFRTAVSKGKGIELNTNRGRQLEEWRGVLALYRDCGGTFATLGADAHRPEDAGKGIAEGAGLLKEYGLKLAVYEARQPRLIEL